MAQSNIGDFAKLSLEQIDIEIARRKQKEKEDKADSERADEEKTTAVKLVNEVRFEIGLPPIPKG